ncbi:EAL domain-containing protein [Geodermatophilus sp. DSM 44513]|uniref:EAL domain-containing protein n=1 Tax=Geodermatophilus sp. DSM 44513 TaxID=1528104 RepID=UPI0028F73F7C|nr:EAL domain-containing protein [Geodermatophilus sp. DSM 44513]WNV75967.1 EAL domain-containing protein [Geodermatophilus sp. DSM 44513]
MTRASSLLDCRPLLADPDDLTMVFQPIVDLAAATVVGYEALARFPGTAGPEVWFAAAAEGGLAAQLEALALVKALAAVPSLPPDTFLSVNVSPHLLGSGPVQEALATRPDLRRVVVELTEHTRIDDLDELRRQTAVLRGRGALVALDDTGSGYSGLQAMAGVRPQLVKLDRSLVSGLDTDPVRTALTEMVGEFAGRIDAWLLAEGVETPGELAALARIGVPLAQGWLLGRPAPDFAPLPADVAALVRTHVTRARRTDSVAGLLRPVRQSDFGEPLPGVPPVVLVTEDGAPVGLWLTDPRTAEPHTAPVSLRVHASDGVTDVLHRALARAPGHRFDPVVCTDPTGAVVGLLRVEDLATAAARR